MAKLTLLLPLDNTGFSSQILPTVRKLFPPEHYRARLLHIANTAAEMTGPLVQPAMVGMDYGFYMYNEPNIMHPIHDEEELLEFREQLSEDLKAQVEALKNLGYEASSTVLFGEPVKDIAEFANKEGVDVVAMATHAHTGFDRFLLGSVAQDVVKHLTVPVLLVRLEDEPHT